jgi:hypothetical protein
MARLAILRSSCDIPGIDWQGFAHRVIFRGSIDRTRAIPEAFAEEMDVELLSDR